MLRLRLHRRLLLSRLRSGLRSLLLLWPWTFSLRRSFWSRIFDSRSWTFHSRRWTFSSWSRTRWPRYAFRLWSLLLLPHRALSLWRCRTAIVTRLFTRRRWSRYLTRTSSAICRRSSSTLS